MNITKTLIAAAAVMAFGANAMMTPQDVGEIMDSVFAQADTLFSRSPGWRGIQELMWTRPHLYRCEEVSAFEKVSPVAAELAQSFDHWKVGELTDTLSKLNLETLTLKQAKLIVPVLIVLHASPKPSVVPLKSRDRSDENGTDKKAAEMLVRLLYHPDQRVRVLTARWLEEGEMPDSYPITIIQEDVWTKTISDILGKKTESHR
ncbi:MAG: hypothetical protein LBJ70_05945 [Holosporales bacterium]|jgi:hypothetical protein|nr:hypothetical protein [Holosporales bacterium]